MFMYVRALTSVQEMRLEVRSKRMKFCPDVSHTVSFLLVLSALVKGTPDMYVYMCVYTYIYTYIYLF